ncbi:hypothetical protein RclHR1_04470007 [Rhizophagus clarus]|uniref:Uncharacterized protein n=1 Tax=Rhizophagus clarus TaxID=94130 RepID=A0A2Z6RH95_9GLOM|nr:hypothetical protein RclHR1_04470007 [Rhizophagus clarus]GES77631.1 hypothetical protein RCL_jg12447.t1 [Rhizophagus clarus]
MSDKSIEDWKAQLIGKKYVLDNVSVASEEQHKVVRKTDLPAEHRVIPPSAFVTMDFKPERLNVYIDHSSTITNVKFG